MTAQIHKLHVVQPMESDFVFTPDKPPLIEPMMDRNIRLVCGNGCGRTLLRGTPPSNAAFYFQRDGIRSVIRCKCGSVNLLSSPIDD